MNPGGNTLGREFNSLLYPLRSALFLNYPHTDIKMTITAVNDNKKNQMKVRLLVPVLCLLCIKYLITEAVLLWCVI